MLAGVMLRNPIPKHIRSDNGAEFDAKVFWEWFSRPEVGTFLIESVGRGRTPTSKTSGQTQVRITQREDLHTLQEAQVLTEFYRREYNQIHPRSSLGYEHPVSGPVIEPTF